MKSRMWSTGAMPAIALSGFGYAIAQRAIRREQELVSVAKRLDVLATEAASLHADNVQPAKSRPVPHHLAIRNDIALNPDMPPIIACLPIRTY